MKSERRPNRQYPNKICRSTATPMITHHSFQIFLLAIMPYQENNRFVRGSRNLADRVSEVKQVTYGGQEGTNKIIDEPIDQSVQIDEGSNKILKSGEMSSLEKSTLNGNEDARGLDVESEPLMVPPCMGEDEQGKEEPEGDDFIKDLMSFDGLGEGADLEDLLGDTDTILDEDTCDAAKLTEVLEDGQLAKMESGNGTNHTVRKKVIPSASVGKGLSLRKRNALLLGSPRKRVMNKSGSKIGEGLYPKKAAGSKANPIP